MGIFPPQTVSPGDQGLIVASMERVALALGARGLVNAQFIVREDGVYLIEVNPRASRTVPFMSKVTGVPMVELAVRISLGATLRELGWSGGLLEPPPLVAVKAPAFSTFKLRGVDPSVGPAMQSTGEVIGLHEDPRVALAKALQGAALIPPRPDPGTDPPLALVSIADRDKRHLVRLAEALVRAGYRLAATRGTRARLAEAGLIVWRVLRIARPEDLDLLPATALYAETVLIEPRVPGAQGGAGVPLDLTLAIAARRRLPDSRLALAGGLTPETVGRAVALVRPEVVDVSSGVESLPGIKDHDKIARFLEAVLGRSPTVG